MSTIDSICPGPIAFFFKAILRKFYGKNMENNESLKRSLCDHILEGGYGLMGDALQCTKCGYSKYPEVFPNLYFYRLRGRIKWN